MNRIRFPLSAVLLWILAGTLTTNAQTPTAISLSFTGSGSGNANAFSLNGSGSMSPFGAATVSISGGGGAKSPTVNFTFTFSDGDTLTASGAATFGTDTLSGTANAHGGTGAFANSAGTFSFTMTAPPGSTSSDIMFTLTGSGTINANLTSCQLQVSPLMITFSALAGGNAAPSQIISIVSACATPAKFAVSVEGGSAGSAAPEWSGVSPPSGTTPGSVSVTANPGTMGAGAYAATILISVPGSTGQASINVPVTFTISTASPRLQVAPGVLHFAAPEQSRGNLTAGLSVSSGGGGGPLSFSTTVVGGSAWISSVSPSSGQTTPNSPVLVTVSVSSGLGVGSYRDEIEISSTAGNVSVPVTLFVAESGPILAVDLTGVRLQAIQGGGFSNAQTIEILNLGQPNSTVNWSASLVRPASWLSLESTSGTATATTPGALTFTLTASATQMSPGGYYALIKISDSNSRNSPQYVLVVLDLASNTSPALPDPNPAGFFFVATAGGSKTSAQVLTINTSSATAVPFQAASSTSDGGTWLIVTPTSGNLDWRHPRHGECIGESGRADCRRV